jgi:hypothetical protein
MAFSPPIKGQWVPLEKAYFRIGKWFIQMNPLIHLMSRNQPVIEKGNFF